MRLLKAASIELVDFQPDQVPLYAILSHTWGADEVLFADIGRKTAEAKPSYDKVRSTCKQTIADGLEYVWIDCCCIDKSSSADLSEAINSMYEWYRKAEICYAYLSDVPAEVDTRNVNSEFALSRWFTRGWTLQELLAPSEMVFYSSDWFKIGEKITLLRPLSEITGIDEDILSHARPLESASVAKRMSWAAHRKTTRPEDIAYCMMGIFGVNMPMLYGEGEKAFLRLQEEIMKESDDQSLFAWVDLAASPDSQHGLLATHPSKFEFSNTIVPYQDWEPRPPYSMSNRGLRIELHLTRREEDIYVAAIDCPAPPDYEDSSFLAIFLQKLSAVDHQYARIKVGQFAKVGERGSIQTISVRQSVVAPELQGVFPHHIFQLRQGPDPPEYRVVNVTITSKTQPEAILSSRTAIRSWVPPPWPWTFKIPKGANRLAGAIILERESDKERLLIMLGSSAGFKVAFDAVEVSEAPYCYMTTFQEFQQVFNPKIPGTYITLENHRVRVNAEPQIHNASKYYMIDIEVDALYKSFRPLQVVKQAIQDATNPLIPELDVQEHRLETRKSSFWRRIVAK